MVGPSYQGGLTGKAEDDKSKHPAKEMSNSALTAEFDPTDRGHQRGRDSDHKA